MVADIYEGKSSARAMGRPSIHLVNACGIAREILLALAALVFLLAGRSQAADSAVAVAEYWTVISVTGHAYELTGSSAWNRSREIVPGDLIGPSQGIATGSDGQVTLRRGADTVTIFTDTIVRLPSQRTGSAPMGIHQMYGRALYVIAPFAGRSFEVTTPYLVAGVRGTTFAVTDDGRRVVLIDGQLLVRTPEHGAGVELTAGFAAVAGGPPAGRIAVEPVPPDVLDAWRTQAATMSRTLRLQREPRDLQDAGALHRLLHRNDVDNAAAGAVGGALKSVGGALDAVGGAVDGVGGAVSGAVSGVGQTLGNALTRTGESVGKVVDRVKDALGGKH